AVGMWPNRRDFEILETLPGEAGGSLREVLRLARLCRRGNRIVGRARLRAVRPVAPLRGRRPFRAFPQYTWPPRFSQPAVTQQRCEEHIEMATIAQQLAVLHRIQASRGVEKRLAHRRSLVCAYSC